MIVLLSAAGVSGALAQDEADTVDRSWRKDVPEITWKNISPPFKDYTYYNHVEVFPFEFNSQTFSAVNAWWLSEAATLDKPELTIDYLRIKAIKNRGSTFDSYFA